MPREFRRHQRVAAQIQRELAGILQFQVRDPRLGLVTVNAVDVSRDLSVAKVYYTVLNADDDRAAENLSVLEQLAPVLRGELGKRIRMRHLPELRFVLDTSVERGMRIDELLQEDRRDHPDGE